MCTPKLPKITKLIGSLPCIVQMTQKILEAEGEGDSVQLDFFLKGNLALEKNSRCKPHSWLPDQVGFMGSLHLLNSLLLCFHVVQAPKLHPSCIQASTLTKQHWYYLAWHLIYRRSWHCLIALVLAWRLCTWACPLNAATHVCRDGRM